MSDNKEMRDDRDRSQINMNESYEVQYWTEKFNVSAEELREAIREADSNHADRVEEALRSRRN